MALALWDLDGTIVEMWDIHTKAYEGTIREVYDIPNVDFRKAYVPGKAPEGIVEDNLRLLGYSDEFIQKKMHLVKDSLAKTYPDAIKKGNVRILQGAGEMLERIAGRNILQGILSGNHRRTVDAILQKTDLDVYFPFRATSSEAPDRKERVLLALSEAEKLSRRKYAPEEIYVFDDSDAVIQSSKDLGIKHVSVATGVISYEDLQKKNPDFLFKDFSNHQEVLKEIGIFSNST